MLLILTLAGLSVVTFGSVVAYQRGARARLLGLDEWAALPAHVPAEERTLETLEVGDVVVHGDEDWLITGTLAYREEDERWWLHHLQGGSGERWLEVRRREELSAALFEPAVDVPLVGQLYDQLTHKGLPFRLVRRGDARVSADGDVGARQGGLYRYATYEGPGGGLLNVDEGEGGRCALTGERVVGEGLMLMPGERRHAAPPEPLHESP
jgi:hypothetical protein